MNVVPDVPGDFLVLCIDSTKLSAEVKFEAAADVGDKKTGGALTDKTFPHLVNSLCSVKSQSCSDVSFHLREASKGNKKVQTLGSST